MIAGVCLGTVPPTLLLYSFFGSGHDQLPLALIAQMLTLIAVGGWCALRGRRLSTPEAAAAVAIHLLLATCAALLYDSSVLRWASAYGLSGVAIMALVVLGLRWCLVLTPLGWAAQVALVASTGPSLAELVFTAAVIVGVIPMHVGYTAHLLGQLEAARQAAELAAEVDTLTGLRNRRGMTKAWPQLAATVAGAGRRMGVLVIDVDHFKAVNDTRGHAMGDAVLAELGVALRSICRGDDLVVRLGGEEFAVIGGFADEAGAVAMAERLRQQAAAGLGRLHAGVTVSVGVVLGAFGAADDEALGRLLVHADAALYRAKSNGRDRVEVAELPHSLARVPLAGAAGSQR